MMPDARETLTPTLGEAQETFRAFAGKLSPTPVTSSRRCDPGRGWYRPAGEEAAVRL